jgi:hypothetical protein
MSTPSAAHEDHDEPERYEIRIKGHLDNRWTGQFSGLTLTREANGETLLTGPMVDQAALFGVLRKVRDLGTPLLSVTRVGSDQADASDFKDSR